VIPCDYCPMAAAHFIQRGSRNGRSFACPKHRERARGAWAPANNSDSGYFTDPPLADRSRFTELNVTECEALWRQKKSGRIIKRHKDNTR
jgi:hypothetical protein